MREFWFKAATVLSRSRRLVASALKHSALKGVARWQIEGLSTIGAGVLCAGLVIGVRHTGSLQSWELLVYDQMIRLRPDAGADDRLLVVTITEADIQAQNRWPLSDAVLAQLLAKLQQHRPAVIGLDLYRDIPQPPGRDRFLQQVRVPNVVSVMMLGDEINTRVLQPPGVPDEQVGFSDFILDSDAVVRRNLLYATLDKRRYHSFALRLSLKYLGDRPVIGRQDALYIDQTRFPALPSDAGGYRGLDDAGWQILVNYRSPQPRTRQVTLTQVLTGQFDRDWVTGKVVLIGTTAPSAKDLFLTPFNLTADESPRTPGVLVHAQMTRQILDRLLNNTPLLWFWPETGEMLWISVWAVLGGAIAGRLRHPLVLGGAVILASTGGVGMCFGLFLLNGWVPLVPALLALNGAVCAVVAHRLRHHAFHDALTGLPNRARFLKHLSWVVAQSRRRSTIAPLSPSICLEQRSSQSAPATKIAVLLLGLDSFKTVNDSFGHPVGDQLLIAVARRLKACLEPTDYLARVGGDEFAILRQVQNSEAVDCLSDRLQQRLTPPFRCAGREVFMTASLGIVLDRANSVDHPEEILRDAHTAMNRAKSTGKARHEVFVTGMRTQVMSRLELETDLRYALKRQEFELYYQPIVALATGKITGFEALVRWHHPQRGLVLPSEFIPVAEEIDLILPLNQWVIQAACEQLCEWKTQLAPSPLLVSVNLSAKQFSQPELVEQIAQTLQETGLHGCHLRLEITETIAMADVKATIALLQRLKVLHLQLSIDDFGTGYSSLSYLHQFPTDTLKVDRSFVRRMRNESEDAHIVQTIIILGHNLGMTVVAEGVETAEQLAQLRALNCDYGQGYFFAPALSRVAIEELLQQDPRW